MIIEKKATLRPILDSSNGIHLTAYLVNRPDPMEMVDQLTETIREANECLRYVMPGQKRKKFLEPLESLLADTSVLDRFKGNIGIFRGEDTFRLVNLPIPVQRGTFIATTFHVKPLLRWLQGDPEFLLLGLQSQSASLYIGTQHSLQLVGVHSFSKPLTQSAFDPRRLKSREVRRARAQMSEELRGLSDWVTQMTIHSTPRLYVAGADWLSFGLFRVLRYKNVLKPEIRGSFATREVAEIVAEIRTRLRSEARQRLQEALVEFKVAEGENLVRRDLHQIGKAVVQGKIRKMIIADGVSVFGKLDRKTGEVSIHPWDMDHEDDDLLDDLAQEVLSRGGEVIVASRDEIPKGRPALAILDSSHVG